MGLGDIFSVAGSGMSAQSIRLNLISSNLANANHVGKTPADTYKAKLPVFETVMAKATNDFSSQADKSNVGVAVSEIVESDQPLRQQYQPGHPNADKNGYVYVTNVSVMDEMANMISATHDYKTNVEVLNTTKQLMVQTINMLNR